MLHFFQGKALIVPFGEFQPYSILGFELFVKHILIVHQPFGMFQIVVACQTRSLLLLFAGKEDFQNAGYIL
jgi:hypothetical protein